MAYRRRIYFTEKQKAEIRDRWQRGEAMSSIGRLFDRNSSSIYPLLARTGGIRPPEQRRRSRLALTLAEREEVSRWLGAELSLRTIARQLQRLRRRSAGSFGATEAVSVTGPLCLFRWPGIERDDRSPASWRTDRRSVTQ